MKKSRAFSLIELIFVIAIIGVMASLGLSYMQHRAQNTKINKSAIQMQQLFQAALAYYNDKGEWPSICNTECKNDFTPYIPIGMQKNPWGTDSYHFAPSPDYKNLHAPKFLIHTSHLPNQTAAIRLAAALPNAKITGGANNEVKAEIALASSSHTSDLPVFGGAGTVASGGKATATCPANWYAHFYASVANITEPSFIAGTKPVSDVETTNDVVQCDSSGNCTTTNLTTKSHGYGGLPTTGIGVLTYVAVCTESNT